MFSICYLFIHFIIHLLQFIPIAAPSPPSLPSHSPHPHALLFSSEKGEDTTWAPTQAHQVISGNGLCSPTETEQDSSVWGTGSTGRQRNQGQPLLQLCPISLLNKADVHIASVL